MKTKSLFLKENKISQEISEEALRWVKNNKDLTVCSKSYNSPRISSEIPDCSMPMTFDSYKFCSMGCNYCVIAGTKISTKKGSIPIEEINVGDIIYSLDLDNKKIVEDTVVATMQKTTTDLIEIELENNQTITITTNHPVYVNGKGWVNAGDLSENDDIIFMAKPGTSFHMSKNNPMRNEKIANKMSQTLKKRYANGELKELQNKLKKSGSRIISAYNKTEKQRKAVSGRMKLNNPMKNKEIANKVGKLLKDKYQNGEIVPYWKGKEKPDAVLRMSGDSNPMKDPEIRKKTLRKIVHSWIKNGRISEGEILVKNAIQNLNESFIHQCFIKGEKRDYIMDFFLPDKNICIEYDGHSGHYSLNGMDKDIKRDNYLIKEYNIKTIRIHRDTAFIDNKDLASKIFSTIKNINQEGTIRI